MLHELPDRPVVRAAIRRATEVLGRDALDLDTPEALNPTVAVQLALFVAGTATARALIAEGGHAAFVAGDSVGAFAAAVIAGTLTFEDAMHLVDLRARSMQAAYPHGYGMGVLIGLEQRTVSQLAAAVNTPEAPVSAANVNTPLQVDISGADDALGRLITLARARGARRAFRLAVSTPSHTPLMAPVAAEIPWALSNVSLHPPDVPYVSNVGGRCAIPRRSATTSLEASNARFAGTTPPPCSSSSERACSSRCRPATSSLASPRLHSLTPGASPSTAGDSSPRLP